MSSSLIRWTPARDLLDMRASMDRLFDQVWGKGWPDAPAASEPVALPIEFKETDEAFAVRAPVPGFTPEEIQVSIDGELLTIRGEHQSEQQSDKDNYHLREWRKGSFQRMLRLPAAVQKDKVEAACKDGVLTLTLPKAAAPSSTKIQVKG